MDTGKIRDNQTYELNQINKDYQKRKEKLVEQREFEMQQLRKQYDNRIETIKNNSDAVINHIRTRASEEINEEQQIARQALENNQKVTTAEKQRYDRNLTQQRQAQLETLKNMKDKFDEQQQDTVNEYHRDLEKIHEQNSQNVAASQSEYLHRQKEVDLENQKNVLNIQQRGQTQVDKLAQGYKEQLEDIHRSGDQKIGDEKSRQDENLRKLRTDYQKDLLAKEQDHAQRVDRELQQFRERLTAIKETHRDTIHNQQLEFSDTFNERQLQNQKNFAAQNRLYNREFTKQKLDWAEKAKGLSQRMNDPFYQLTDPRSHFRETENAYLLTTYIPDYDKKSVKIVVQPDKISVQGNRTFKDQVKQDERSVSSHKVENFREEYQFSQPVLEKGVVQERDGDYVTVTIPKIVSMNKAKGPGLT